MRTEFAMGPQNHLPGGGGGGSCDRNVPPNFPSNVLMGHASIGVNKYINK